ncbi:MAG: membrane lipoprotein lipid attachment site-containing protein [Prevotella sp.]|nr:membrane lipoprotein lipid attachment site-containing protein [Prevotella sp.]
MKKVLFAITALLMLWSCSNEEETIRQNDVVGKWQKADSKEITNSPDVYTFYKDGIFSYEINGVLWATDLEGNKFRYYIEEDIEDAANSSSLSGHIFFIKDVKRQQGPRMKFVLTNEELILLDDNDYRPSIPWTPQVPVVYYKVK